MISLRYKSEMKGNDERGKHAYATVPFCALSVLFHDFAMAEMRRFFAIAGPEMTQLVMTDCLLRIGKRTTQVFV